jgi:hypothetical protein
MNFGQALETLKRGGRMAREGWNGRGMWIYYSPGNPHITVQELWSPVSQAFAQAQGGVATVRPYLMMKTAQEDLVPWVASQTDLLAEDWVDVV